MSEKGFLRFIAASLSLLVELPEGWKALTFESIRPPFVDGRVFIPGTLMDAFEEGLNGRLACFKSVAILEHDESPAHILTKHLLFVSVRHLSF